MSDRATEADDIRETEDAAAKRVTEDTPSGVYRLDPADFPGGVFMMLDQQSDIATYYNQATSPTDQSFWDATEQACGLEMPGLHPANVGNYQLGTGWSGHDEITLAFRYRVNQEFIDGGGYLDNGGVVANNPKLHIFFASGTCGDEEWTTVNQVYNGYPLTYGNCGSSFSTFYLAGNVDHQPNGSCFRANNMAGVPNPPRPSWDFVADVWTTYVLWLSNINFASGPYRLINWYAYLEGEGNNFPNQWAHIGSLAVNDTGDDVRAPRPAGTLANLNTVNMTLFTTGKNSSVPHTPWRALYREVMLYRGDVRATYGIPF